MTIFEFDVDGDTCRIEDDGSLLAEHKVRDILAARKEGKP